MSSLQDIWNAPAETVSSRARSNSKSPPPPDEDDNRIAGNLDRSTTRSRKPLFLDSGSEDEARPSSKGGAFYASKPGSSKPNIDAFWDDLDDPDAGVKELPPALDIGALKRQTEARLALTPHQILPSSSPPRDTESKDDDAKGKKKGKDGKPLKKRAILNEGRILGPDGFPALIKQTKDFKPKGKGHELSDLNRLMTVYHFWSHNMFPNTQFITTTQRVEKLCHSKRMHVALRVWRDEAKGLINGLTVPDAADNDAADNSDDDSDDARPRDVPIATEDERSSPAPSRGPSAPPTSASEGELDDFDIDALIQEEEAARTSSTAPRPVTSSVRRAPVAAVDDDEDMWDAVMGDLPDEPFVPQERHPIANNSAKRSVPPADEDEDMWDIMDEMELDTGTNATAKSSGSSVREDAAQQSTAGVGAIGVDPSRKATNDEGWDEMYA